MYNKPIMYSKTKNNNYIYIYINLLREKVDIGQISDMRGKNTNCL